MNILGISTSPRFPSNSDILLRQSLAGAESAGMDTDYIRLSDYDISPCIACNACSTTGHCRIQDDYQELLQKILDADRLIFATPLYFMSVCAQAKTLIDRGQCLWAYKYILKKQLFLRKRDRRAMVIAVGGSKSKKQFESVRLTMMSYFDVLEFNYVLNLFVSQIDGPGEIQKHPSMLEEAYRIGKEFVDPNTPCPEKPIDVTLV
jgi:multimeric flavodoxin WrbA